MTRFGSILLDFCVFLFCCNAAQGLSNNADGTCKIVGMGATQYLPKSYVKSFPRWYVRVKASGTIVPEEMKDKEVSLSSSTITMQPSLDILLQNGVPKYAMAGLQFHSEADDCGVSSPFIASQWINFANVVEPSFRVVLFVGSGDGTDDVLLVQANPSVIQEALGRLGNLLVADGVASVSTGFHILSFPLQFRKRDENSGEEAVSWVDDQDRLPLSLLKQNLSSDGMATVLATGEQDAREVMTLLDSQLVEMTVTSSLQIPAHNFFAEVEASAHDAEL